MTSDAEIHPTEAHYVEASFVRPYMITQGRTVGAAGDIALETLVVARQGAQGLAPDHATIVAICSGDQPVSIIEIALQTNHPIGVARVLVADLTASGHVEQYETSVTGNEDLVRRVLEGIRSL